MSGNAESGGDMTNAVGAGAVAAAATAAEASDVVAPPEPVRDEGNAEPAHAIAVGEASVGAAQSQLQSQPQSPCSEPTPSNSPLPTPASSPPSSPTSMVAHKPRASSLMTTAASAVRVALLSKNLQARVEIGTVGSDGFRLGEIYLNELSDLRVLEMSNTRARWLRLQLKVEMRKPFHKTRCQFQLENENLSLVEELQREDRPIAMDEYSHAPSSIVRSSSKAALCAENVYLSDGYNELFNYIDTMDELVLEPHETKRVVLAFSAKLSSQHASETSASSSYSRNPDSSEEERMHLNETSCLVLMGRLTVKMQYDVRTTTQVKTPPVPLPDMVIPLQGQVCRSLLRLDVKELHFDDCIPGGSFVKDFTVWNRSEIPLLFKLVSSMSAFDETRELLAFTDYNSGYTIGEKTLQAAAYGHVRIRVTYRPVLIGERFFEVSIQNLHDARNVKMLKIHAVTNKEHHREGLSMKEPNGSYMMSGSKLDFGDCYTGIATSKMLLVRNTTDASLHVELASDRPKEVTFEMKVQQNRVRSSRAPRQDDILSPTGSNEGSSRKGSLSPDASKAVANTFANVFDSHSGYGVDSDDDGEENEADFYDEEFTPTTRSSFEELAMGEQDDGDDDFEFDGEPRALTRSPVLSPKFRRGQNTESRRRSVKQKNRRPSKLHSRVRDLAFESGVDSAGSGNSVSSSPERKHRGDLRSRNSLSVDDSSGSNFLVETIDLPPGVERTILIWYNPISSSSEPQHGDISDSIDSKACRLTKQTFRVSFRCFQLQGPWQQAQSRVYDRTLGKSIHIRARTCTSIVTVTPSILHLGDCNIGELKSSPCMLTNHSELPTVVRPLVTSKVVSTVPNDEMTLGPKQSLEVKVEIIPRKINPNYTRLISIMNLKNKSNIPQICVRSSNMDAHHVIYHSLFYKLLTQSRSAFLNFDQVAVNSLGIQFFDLENITNAPLFLTLQSSDPTRVKLFSFRIPTSNGNQSLGSRTGIKPQQTDETKSTAHGSASKQGARRNSNRVIRRRRSFGCMNDLLTSGPSNAKNKSAAFRGYLTKKILLNSPARTSGTGASPAVSQTESDKSKVVGGRGGAVTPPPVLSATQVPELSSAVKRRGSFSFGSSSMLAETSLELMSLLELYKASQEECDGYCQTAIPNLEKESEVFGMIEQRTRRLQSLVREKKLVPLNGNKERNVRVPAKSLHRVVAVLSPLSDPNDPNAGKIRVEKHKIFITLPPGGNKKAAGDTFRTDPSKSPWAASKHPFDSRPSVRELLVKSLVCRSVMNVNQKNINFGRITVSSRSSKKLVVQNMSAVPLAFTVEKTGSISSAFLEIKEGDRGVVKPFGTKDICFEFQPILAGAFEEKLKIVNVQDPENSILVTIKAKVVKRETFKLLHSGQVLSFGKCLVGEKSDEVKIAVRNTSRKKREYVIELDPSFSNQALRPTFYFCVDNTPSSTITQAQEKKLDEELEKLEHKLRIAVTKKKTDKITKLNAKISRVKALLSGEHIPEEVSAEAEGEDHASTISSLSTDVSADIYDSNSESEFSEGETHPKPQKSKKDVKTAAPNTKSSDVQQHHSTNSIHFSLEAEGTGRIVAYAVFHHHHVTNHSEDASQTPRSDVPLSQKARKRQLRKDATPLVGVGKLLLFEQQNKDVMKELQYNSEVFLRNGAGERAYYRAVGKAPLPPFPHSTLTRRPSPRPSEQEYAAADEAATRRNLISEAALAHSSPYEVDVVSSTPQHDARDPHALLRVDREPSGAQMDRLAVEVVPDQVGMFRRSTLLIPIEESPVGTLGWIIKISQSSGTIIRTEVQWRPSDVCRGLLGLVCDVNPSASLLQVPSASKNEGTENIPPQSYHALPIQVAIPSNVDVTIHMRWCYSAGSGYGSGTALASCVSSSTLEAVTKVAHLVTGKLEISEITNEGSESSPCRAGVVKSIDVGLVKAVKRTLDLESDLIELGQQPQSSTVKGEFVLVNRSRHPVKFLVIIPSVGDPTGQTSTGISGEFSFESSTGRVEAHGRTVVHFSYRTCDTPGHHVDQILIRNLNDRLDSSLVSVRTRITRPVYVRIPELDQHATGTLDVLDLGSCYVTPEMQDTSVDSPNLSLKFSKVHKLTLVSQVNETLVVCASSNLKTQCYVYEDMQLHREATNVVMAGTTTVDLYIAVRPRLPADAFKTGASRDLVGGIRMQLFRSVEKSSLVDEKHEMVAEFTIKFIGVAGPSLARVTPSTIDFGVELRPSGLQEQNSGQVHQGHFDLHNLSKGLPHEYRLLVENDPDKYSDEGDALEVTFDQDRGLVLPGESSEIKFQVIARCNGLYRRRILVDNLNYPGKINWVDIVVFIDVGVLLCTPIEQKESSSNTVSSTHNEEKTVDLGVVAVVKLEETLLGQCLPAINDDSNSTRRRYRILPKYFKGAYDQDLTAPPARRCLQLTNLSDEVLNVRAISTLPMSIRWIENFTDACHLEAREKSAFRHESKDLDLSLYHCRMSQYAATEGASSNVEMIFQGEDYKIQPRATCFVSFKFDLIAATTPLPSDALANGKQYPFRGMIGIQRISGSDHSASSARTLKLVDVIGKYGESLIHIAEKIVSLGKVGYSLGWRSSPFEIIVKNTSGITTNIALGNLPDNLVVSEAHGAVPVNFSGVTETSCSDNLIPSLSSLILRNYETEARSCVWTLAPFSECVMVMEFTPTSKPLPAGPYEFPLKVFNLRNPHNIEVVRISAHIVSSYAKVIIDPDSTGDVDDDVHATSHLSDNATQVTQVALLPPVMVPPPIDTNQSTSFWFTVRNLVDEVISVKLSAFPDEDFKSTWELLLFSRSSKASVSDMTVAPGDSVDIRVKCRVFPSARITPEMLLSSTHNKKEGDLLRFGKICLNMNVQNMPHATQTINVCVKGKVIPGRTFELSSSSLHFYAEAAALPTDIPTEMLPSSLRTKLGNRESAHLNTTMAESSTGSLFQLRTSSEVFWIRNPPGAHVLNFSIDQVAMCNSGLCLIKGANTSEMYAMSEYIQAVPSPSSGTVLPGEAAKITVRLEEGSVLFQADEDQLVGEREDNSKAFLRKMRRHPSWRSNSWGDVVSETARDIDMQNHMYLTVRDMDMSAEMALTADVDVHLVLKDPSLPVGGTNASLITIDSALLKAAFVARELRLSKPITPFLPPSLPSQVDDSEDDQEEIDGSMLDNFEEFDVGSIQSGSAGQKNRLPVLSVRGCTPAENSTLDNTRYVVDVGQHTVRKGGEVEWEITVESMYNHAVLADSGPIDPVDYRIILVDQSARSWLQLSRDRGTLDRNRRYQSVVLYFLRESIGVYSTFVVLQNVTNPGDLKVIQVKLEVVADLNSLRSMSSGVDPTTNLFRVLVSNHAFMRKHRRASDEMTSTGQNSTGLAPDGSKLVVDYGEVFYRKLYHNHSIVLENSSSMTLDFMLSSNARANEVSFSVSPTSFNEVTTVTLQERGRVQVFVHFCPQPKQVGTEAESSQNNDDWNREIEVYVSCRLVKDFRETVVLRATCYQPQLTVNVASTSTDTIVTSSDLPMPANMFSQSNFPGLVYSMSEPDFAAFDADPLPEAVGAKLLVVHNTRTDSRARIAMRNDSMFFSVTVDEELSTSPGLDVENVESGICAGRRTTLLVNVAAQCSVVFRVTPDVVSLRKHRQKWDHNIKEHIALYNIKQFAEHYQIPLCFTCSNLGSYYVPPNIVESYPFLALEDTIAKFLQNYNATWQWLIDYHRDKQVIELQTALPMSSSPLPTSRLAEVLADLDAALEQSSPLSPRAPGRAFAVTVEFDEQESEDREELRQLLQSYRALYFDFFYITDELVWYGVRSNAVRRSLMLADLAYGVVFNHDIFRAFLAQTSTSLTDQILPRLLLPWIRQLRHFLSYFPENQEATLPLRQLYGQLHKFERG